jgi:G3E family GTPase
LKTLVFAGPPGSGKTTTAGNTFRSGLLAGKKIYIINDEGDGTATTVDAGILRGIEGLDLSALTSGCIGCRDEKEFKEAIRRIQADGTVDWLVIEPVGYAAGHEVPGILHALGIRPTVVCLVDVENFEDNLVDGFMPTQIHAAHAVALTKYGDAKSIDDSRLEAVMSFVGEHNPKASVFLLEKGADLPRWVVAPRHEYHPTCNHHHDHGHNHDHDHEDHKHEHHHAHDHEGDGSDHGTFSITLKLLPDVTYERIRQIAAAIPGIFRGKGVAENKQWHLVQRKWELESDRLPDDRPPFATFYSRQPLSTDDFISIVMSAEDAYTGQDTRQILRSHTVSVSDLERAIKKRLAMFPTEAFTNRFGDLVTHPEVLSVTMQLIMRMGVPKPLVAEAIKASIRYWLSAVNLLQSRQWDNDSLIGEWEQRLSVALAWYGWNNASDIGSEMKQVVAVRPAHMMCRGLVKHRRFHSNFAKAKVQVSEICDAIRFGMRWEGMTQDKAILAMSDCLAVIEQANRGDDLVTEWRNTMGFIQGLRL